jgi:hypothetical protein
MHQKGSEWKQRSIRKEMFTLSPGKSDQWGRTRGLRTWSQFKFFIWNLGYVCFFLVQSLKIFPHLGVGSLKKKDSQRMAVFVQNRRVMDDLPTIPKALREKIEKVVKPAELLTELHEELWEQKTKKMGLTTSEYNWIDRNLCYLTGKILPRIYQIWLDENANKRVIERALKEKPLESKSPNVIFFTSGIVPVKMIAWNVEYWNEDWTSEQLDILARILKEYDVACLTEVTSTARIREFLPRLNEKNEEGIEWEGISLPMPERMRKTRSGKEKKANFYCAFIYRKDRFKLTEIKPSPGKNTFYRRPVTVRVDGKELARPFYVSGEVDSNSWTTSWYLDESGCRRDEGNSI